MKNMKKSSLTMSMLGVVAVVLSGCTGGSATTGSTENLALAECLTAKGVVMYGTDRCPHCKDQKAAFGQEAFAKVTYVDCDKSANVCQLEGVQGYPTWKFSDGTTLPGTQPLETLAQQAGCVAGDMGNGEMEDSEIVTTEEVQPEIQPEVTEEVATGDISVDTATEVVVE